MIQNPELFRMQVSLSAEQSTLANVLFPYPQVSCPRKLGHKNIWVRVSKVYFPGCRGHQYQFYFDIISISWPKK
jgi:hypothetical protein